MTVVVASIVEGDGEVAALPLLLRRMTDWLASEQYVEIPEPIRVHRDRFLNRDEEFERMCILAAGKSSDDGSVLIILDADDDCPVELATQIKKRALEVIGHRNTIVIIANREYESWFIASASSLDGKRGFQLNAEANEPDSVRGAKEWMSKRILGGRYRERTDQPAFTALMDLELARRHSRSFRKLCTEWQKQFAEKNPV